METIRELIANWTALLDVWRSGQVGLPTVPRWSKYDKPDDPHGGVRSQNSLQHSYSIILLGRLVLEALRAERVYLDGELLLTTLHLHDHGEGELGQDTLYIDKTDDQDLREYLAFVKRFEKLPPSTFTSLEIAFLLQFAAKNPAVFPDHARTVMRTIVGAYAGEMLAFDFVERLDYVLYALEQFRDRGNRRILVQVLRHQLPKLERLAEQLPAIRKTLWTPETHDTCLAFLAEHEGQWIEHTGER